MYTPYPFGFLIILVPMTNAMRAIAAIAAGVGSVAATVATSTTSSISSSTTIINTSSATTIGGNHTSGSTGFSTNSTLLDADHLPLQLTTAKVDLDIEIDIQLLTNGYDGTTVSCGKGLEKWGVRAETRPGVGRLYLCGCQRGIHWALALDAALALALCPMCSS